MSLPPIKYFSVSVRLGGGLAGAPPTWQSHGDKIHLTFEQVGKKNQRQTTNKVLKQEDEPEGHDDIRTVFLHTNSHALSLTLSHSHTHTHHHTHTVDSIHKQFPIPLPVDLH